MTTPQQFKTTDVLRLEVETDPTGLVNLVQNPSGDLGGYGWITPLSNSLIFNTNGGSLSYTRSVSGASFFYTEALPITAFQYAAASLQWTDTSGSYVKIRFEWLDSGGALLSSSTQSSLFGDPAVNTTIPYGPFQAPASTAYVRLRFDVYTSGGANPTGAHYVQFNQVTVAKAATSGALGTLRTNLIVNPSLETVATNYTGSSATVAVVTGGTGGVPTAQAGTKVLKMTSTSATSPPSVNVLTTSLASVTAGKDYTFSIYSQAATTGRFVRVGIRFFDVHGTLISGSTTNTLGTNVTGSWTRLSSAGTAPANAQTAQAYVLFNSTTVQSSPIANAEVHYVDAAMLEQASSAGTYFDGSTAAGGGWTYGWTGTSGNSTSTATSSNLAYVEPIEYWNILQECKAISIHREDLDIGTLSAEIISTALDPATNTLIRPGRQCRLTTNQGSGDTWYPIFTGKVSAATVTYELKDPSVPDTKQARVNLTAVDNVATLTQQARAYGVSTVAELPYVLEGCGVPWNVNGSGNQVSSATLAAYNENASALDQVAVVRDSTNGYAWVDTQGVINVYDKASMPAPTTGQLITNGTFETDASGWESDNGFTTLARSTTQFRTGTASLRVTASGSFIEGAQTISRLPVVGGKSYTFNAYSRAATAARLMYLTLTWYDASGHSITVSNSDAGTATNTTTGWTLVGGAVVAPVNADSVKVILYTSGAAAGEIHYWDDVTVTGPVADMIATSDYSDLDIEYDTDACINEVNVKYVRYNSSTQETEEIAYGPYRDETSIATWGVHSAEFTVQGISEGTVSTFADAVLAANGTPTRRATSVVLPMIDTTDLATWSDIDLYSLYSVSTSLSSFTGLRVTSIEHTIEPEKWLIKLGFTRSVQVAAPQLIPSPGNPAPTDGTWIAPTLTSSWVNYGAPYATAGYMRKNGIVYLQGLIRSGTVGATFMTLPAGYRPANAIIVPGVVNAVTDSGVTISDIAARININADGTCAVSSAASTPSNGYLSLSSISFPAEA